MALTVTGVHVRQPLGTYFERVHDITFDSSYPTGGESLTAADLGYPTEVFFIGTEIVTGTVVRTIAYDRTGAKLLAYDPGGTQIADTTNLSTIVVRIRSCGR